MGGQQGPSRGPRTTHTQGRVGDISLGSQSFLPGFPERGALREAEALQQTPTSRKSPLSSQGTRMPLLPLPQPPGKVGSSLPGRGGQARLGVGPWRPGPGTQQRKCQALTPGCLQGGPSKGHAAPLVLQLSSPCPSAPSLWLPGPPTGSSPSYGSQRVGPGET